MMHLGHEISFGFLMEFELKEIITERMSISSSIHPEFIYYEKVGMTGGHAPTFIGCLNFNFGIKYKLKKD